MRPWPATEPALHAQDCADTGFRWVVVDDREQSVFAYLRMPGGNGVPLLVVNNFTPVPRSDYRLAVPEGGTWHAVLNTDAACYGGSDFASGGGATAELAPPHGQPISLALNLPPLATLVLRLEGTTAP